MKKLFVVAAEDTQGTWNTCKPEYDAGNSWSFEEGTREQVESLAWEYACNVAQDVEQDTCQDCSGTGEDEDEGECETCGGSGGVDELEWGEWVSQTTSTWIEEYDPTVHMAIESDRPEHLEYKKVKLLKDAKYQALKASLIYDKAQKALKRALEDLEDSKVNYNTAIKLVKLAEAKQ